MEERARYQTLTTDEEGWPILVESCNAETGLIVGTWGMNSKTNRGAPVRVWTRLEPSLVYELIGDLLPGRNREINVSGILGIGSPLETQG